MFAASLAAMVLIAVAFTGCGKDSDNKGGGGANSVEWDPSKTVHPDQEGRCRADRDRRYGDAVDG